MGKVDTSKLNERVKKNSLFSVGKGTTQTGEENAQTENTTTSTTKRLKKAEKTPKQVFSFRGSETDVKDWRLYALCSDMKVDELGSRALNEYIKKHPLTGIEKELFEQRKSK